MSAMIHGATGCVGPPPVSFTPLCMALTILKGMIKIQLAAMFVSITQAIGLLLCGYYQAQGNLVAGVIQIGIFQNPKCDNLIGFLKFSHTIIHKA